MPTPFESKTLLHDFITWTSTRCYTGQCPVHIFFFVAKEHSNTTAEFAALDCDTTTRILCVHQETENELLQAPKRAEMYRRISDRAATTVLRVLSGRENDTEINNDHHMNRQYQTSITHHVSNYDSEEISYGTSLLFLLFW